MSPTWNEVHVAFGAALSTRAVALLVVGAAAALGLSALALWRGARAAGGRRRAAGLFLLRSGGVLACLWVALEPRLELRQVTPVPNTVAVLVDVSRSMQVRPPDGGPSRAERAVALVQGAASTFDGWRRDGHRVETYTFGETLEAAPAAGPGGHPPAGATRIGEALSDLAARAAGRDVGAVIVVSDGIDTGRLGSGPLDADTSAALGHLGAPVHTVLVGEEGLRDLSVAAVRADGFAFVRTPLRIDAVVRQRGLAGRQVPVTLLRDGRPIDERTVALEGPSSETRVGFDLTPDHPGEFVFEVRTPVLGGEALADNNAHVFTLRVIRDRVRVLHLCGRPSWDERFLRSLLRRDPNVDLVSFFILRTETDEQPWNPNEMSLIPFPTKEIFADQLRSFDVVIFQNFNYAPYHVGPYLDGLREYVEGGGALAMLGGDLSFAGGGYGATPLARVLPVDIDVLPPGAEDHALVEGAFRPRLTAEGKTHPVTGLSLDAGDNEARWAALPAVDSLNLVGRLHPGAVALLEHPTRVSGGRPAPVLAVGSAGQGRTLALMTDGAWHWGFLAAGAGADGRAFQRFWDNALRWLVRDPALLPLRVDVDRAEVRTGEVPAARVRTLRSDFSASGGVSVALTLRRADDAADAAPLRAMELTTGDDGEGRVDLGGLGAGAYRLQARATLDGRSVAADKAFVVRADEREIEDVTPRPAVLRALSDASGGTARDGSSLAGLALRPPREVKVGRQETRELWSSPLVLLLAVTLLGSEWLLRRRAGYA